MRDLFAIIWDMILEVWWLWAAILLSIAMLVVVIFAAMEGEKRWQKFAVDNECTVTERIPSTTTVGTAMTFDAKGNIVIGPTIHTVPERRKYVCRDESIHWR